ncbi:MAG: hypothetical protein EA398_02535 [Deltaproteobacteria bacterium]|nr:MAG: hypothetical protein EA398_02535 [Deltaproteobacteria bacterium]
MQEEGRNVLALLSLFCGITSWVPWVVVITAPLAWGFAIAAHVTALRHNQRRGLQLAWLGALLAALGVLLHLAIVLIFVGLGGLFPSWDSG